MARDPRGATSASAAAGSTLDDMERAGSNSKQAFLLAAAMAGLVLAIPAGRWIGKPRPVSGTVPVAWRKGPPLPLPAPDAVTRCEVRTFAAKKWREMPLESGRKALAALARNYESLPPPGVICRERRSPELEIRFTTRDDYTVRVAMDADGRSMSDHMAQSPDGQVSGIPGDFVVEGDGRCDVRDAIAQAFVEGGTGDGNRAGLESTTPEGYAPEEE